MTTLFLIHTAQDAACAAQLRQDLGVRGYPLWLAAPDGHGDAWEPGLGDSRTVVVVWSTAAAQDALVAQQIERATWLYKPELVVAVVEAPLPASRARVPVAQSTRACTDASAQLLAHLTPGGGSDLLHELLAQQPSGTPTTMPQPAAMPVVVSRPDGSGLWSTVGREGKQLDTLQLPCGTPDCDERIVAEEDCESHQ